MNMGEVKLIGSAKSLYCARIEWALRLKGVDFEYLEERDPKNKSQTLLKYNPVHKKIPVLLHEGKPVAESLVILEYIDDTWTSGTPLLPSDPLQRANARFWARFHDEKVLLGSFRACIAQGEKKEKAIESAKECFAFLEKEISGKKFFSGKSIGYLDLVVGWVPLWLDALQEVGDVKLIGADEFPCLHDWSANFMDIASIKECLPSRESLVELFNAHIGQWRNKDPN